MNQLDKFNQSVQVLVKAYLEGKLMLMNCSACAVGNLVHAAMKYEWCGDAWIDAEGYFIFAEWDEEDYGFEQRAAIGYDLEQVKRIETAFEGWYEYAGQPTTEFAGLMRVVDVLADIHGIDLTTTAAAKALFVKA